MRLQLAAAALAACCFTTTANAECRFLGTEYAAGSNTRDLSGSRIWCNLRGQWQSVPLHNIRPYVGPDGRFRPTILPPPYGSAEWYRYQSNPQLYRKQEAYRRYGLPPAPVFP